MNKFLAAPAFLWALPVQPQYRWPLLTLVSARYKLNCYGCTPDSPLPSQPPLPPPLLLVPDFIVLWSLTLTSLQMLPVGPDCIVFHNPAWDMKDPHFPEPSWWSSSLDPDGFCLIKLPSSLQLSGWYCFTCQGNVTSWFNQLVAHLLSEAASASICKEPCIVTPLPPLSLWLITHE